MLAAVPEDDLPALQDLKVQTQNHIVWTVHTVGNKPIMGLVPFTANRDRRGQLVQVQSRMSG